MVSPSVASRMKQWRCGAGDRIDSREVRAFMTIAAVASQGEIVGIVATALLLCDDVFDVMK
ncbi:MAG TPA: hypothetical protein VHY84_18275 [Bryobacteraceae bacterium]|nr:hypothetical protein [Bryobacteraceae bacterium]